MSPLHAPTHRVRIHYTEHVGQESRPFVHTESFAASSPAAACAAAVAEFERLALLSSVGWVREIERIEIETLATLRLRRASELSSATPEREQERL